MSWTYVGALLSRTASGDLGPNRVVERPKVIYNSSTKKYVLYLHIDDSSYGEAKVGVATGDSVCGKYTYISSWRPLGFQSRDIGLYQDTDGKAYLLTEDVSLVLLLLIVVLTRPCCDVILTRHPLAACQWPPDRRTHIRLPQRLVRRLHLWQLRGTSDR